MLTIKASTNLPAVHIGRQGENASRLVEFDVSEWVKTFGPGVPSLLVQRPTEIDVYPAVVTLVQERVVWVVRDTDVAIAGAGRMQLQYAINSQIVKSVEYNTYVEPSLGATTASGDPSEPFVNQVLEAAVKAEQAAGRAEAAAERAENAKPEVDQSVVQKSVEEYFRQNPIEVPQVPEWAMSPSKPKYTAQEVGAVCPEGLNTDGMVRDPDKVQGILNLMMQNKQPRKLIVNVSDDGVPADDAGWIHAEADRGADVVLRYYGEEYRLESYGARSARFYRDKISLAGISRTTVMIVNDTFRDLGESEYIPTADKVTAKPPKSLPPDTGKTVQKVLDALAEKTMEGGKDGFSPAVAVSPVSGGNRVTITDATGEKSFDVNDGKDGENGKTPVKGVDYDTPQDRKEIAEAAAKLVPPADPPTAAEVSATVPAELPPETEKNAQAVLDALAARPAGGGTIAGLDLGITGAEVGQYIEVLSVNDQGQPTGWKAVPKPAGGGGGGLQWHKIRYVTEAPGLISVTIPSNAVYATGKIQTKKNNQITQINVACAGFSKTSNVSYKGVRFDLDMAYMRFLGALRTDGPGFTTADGASNQYPTYQRITGEETVITAESNAAEVEVEVFMLYA